MPAERKPTVSEGGKKMWEVQHVLFKQRAAISKLRADNIALKEELMLENKFSVTPSQTSAAELIANLQSQSDVYTNKIQAEQQRLGQVAAQVRGVKGHVATQRRKMGGTDAATKEEQAGQTKIRLLENKLEQGYHALNEECAAIKAIRAKVDGLRRERLLFADVLAKADRAWTAQKADMVSLIEAASQAHEQKAKAEEDAGAVKRASDRENATYEAEWRQLSKLIEADRRQQEAARAKEVEERDKRTAALLASGAAAPAGDDVDAQVAALLADSTQGQKANKGADEHEEGAPGHAALQRMEQLASYFETVRTATGEGDMAKLAATMSAKGEGAYSRFAYLAELNVGVEILSDAKAKLQAKVDAVKSEAAKKEAEAEAVKEELARSLDDAVQAADGAEGRRAEASNAIVDLCEGATAAFEAAGCGESKLVRELLGDGGAKETNLMSYLGCLEQRLSELLLIREAVEAANRPRRSTREPVSAPRVPGSRRETGASEGRIPGGSGILRRGTGLLRTSSTGSAIGSRRFPQQGLLGKAAAKAASAAGSSVPGVQLGKGRSAKDRSSAASGLPNLRDLVPVAMLPSMKPTENDPTASMEANDTRPLTYKELKARAEQAIALRRAALEAAAAAAASRSASTSLAAAAGSSSSSSAPRGGSGKAPKPVAAASAAPAGASR